MSVAVVLLAAGRGERLGAGIPKALVEVAGQTLLEHSLERTIDFSPDQIVVVAPADELTLFESIVTKLAPDAVVVAGGATRQASAAAGLAQVTTERVLIHDSARAFAPASLYQSVADALVDGGRVVVPGLPVADTIKRVQDATVVETPLRSDLRRIQTPQGFFVSDLMAAYREATGDYTDDAGLMESRGVMPVVVAGDELAAKVTTPNDLAQLRQSVGSPRDHIESRAGIGSDAHRFGTDGTLQLGCLEWPELPQLEGHSDGDAMAHAMVDAMLSAAGLGDIGSNFGTDRPEYAAASGEVFIRGAVALLTSAGYRVINVAVQVVADLPKVGPRRAELQQRLTELVGAPVTVAATTTDGLGFLADSRGIGCLTTALIQRRG